MATRHRIAACCSLRNAFGGDVALFIDYKWRHSDIIIIKLTAFIQNEIPYKTCISHFVLGVQFFETQCTYTSTGCKHRKIPTCTNETNQYMPTDISVSVTALAYTSYKHDSNGDLLFKRLSESARKFSFRLFPIKIIHTSVTQITAVIMILVPWVALMIYLKLLLLSLICFNIF